jgi:succinate-semialdehyde dehydrogenase/glutarate-semialdehyde dehydrogenase
MIDSPLLPRSLGYIAGQWLGPDSGESFAVINPATGDELAQVPKMTAGETGRAIAAAHAAMRDPTSLDDRRNWLQAIGDQLLANKAELGRIITLEQGKPLAEGVAETEYAAGFFHFFATKVDEFAVRELADRPRSCRWRIYLRPTGVVGSITPWNFPIAMMAKKVSAALGAGCAVVAKPASQTPLAAIAYASICEHVGLPEGMFNLVVGPAGPIGDTLCTHPHVRLITFTGSTKVGKQLAEQCAPHLKRLALELGGNAPFIVFDDADIDTVADQLIKNKFRAAGQTCVCTNRVYVERRIEDQFTRAVADRVQGLKVGNGLHEGTDVGPLINRDGWEKVAEHVRDAIDRGATRIVGHDPPRPEQNWGAFYPPTVLTNVKSEMLVCREETFGPVVAISQFDTEAEALAAANDTEYGLAAYLFTADPARAKRMVAGLQFGHVGVNTGAGPTPEAPFGGVKHSGYGREGGLEGLLEYCEPQTVPYG